MEYKVTDVVEVFTPNENGIEINIGIGDNGNYTDIGSIRIKVKPEHYLQISGLESAIKRHFKKINEH
jgi:hypothetical protein